MNLDIVYNNLLFKNNISESDLVNLLNNLCIIDSDYGDIYLQDSYSESLILENNILKRNILKYKQGVSIRLNKNNNTIFSYSSIINKKSILELIKKLGLVYKQNILDKNKKLFIIKNKLINNIISPINFKFNINKINILFDLYNYIKKMDSRINYITINLISKYDLILVANTNYSLSFDIRPMINILIKVNITSNNNNEIGISGGGGSYSFEELLNKKYDNDLLIYYWASESVRIAINNLYAINAPAGKMPIVLASGSPGVLLHEAVGHGLESDFISKKISIFSNLLNKKVASKHCTVIDDSSIFENKGSYSIDDEGEKSRKKILIKNGILKTYLLDKFNARLLDLRSNGSARKESFSDLPLPRMSNTYLCVGKYCFNEIINSIDYGLYISHLSGGQVDISSGNFVFTILEGYLIKKGRIMNPVKGATLIGSSVDIMKKISMVGNDFKFDHGMGWCVKENQVIPVNVGQPTLKINDMIVGGLNK